MAEVRVKAGVQPKLLVIVVAVCNEAQRLGVELAPADAHVTITSGIDGTRVDDSGYYQLRALDVRSKNFRTRAAKDAFLAGLRRRLGPRYTVLIESEGTPREHVHIQPVRRSLVGLDLVRQIRVTYPTPFPSQAQHLEFLQRVARPRAAA